LIQTLWRDFSVNGQQRGEYALLRKDGAVVEVEYRAVAHFFPGQHLAILRDVTQCRRTEESAQVALTKYKTLFDAFPLGITVSDATGNILETNRMAEQLLGVLPVEHQERTLDDPRWRIIRPDGALMSFEEYASVRALRENRLIQDVEMGVAKPTDEVVWLNVTAAPLPLEGYGVVVAYSDITEHKRAERALQLAQERLELAIEGAGVGLYDANLNTGEVTVNQRYLEIRGYAPGEIAAITVQSWWETIHPHDQPRVLQMSEDCRQGRQEHFALKYRIRHRSGRWIWVMDRGKAFNRDAAGNPQRAAGTCLDITEQYEAELQLTDQAERLRQLSRTLLSVQEDERRVLARELHDDLGQQLAALKLNLNLAFPQQHPGEAANQRRLADCLEIVDYLHERLQSTAHNLRPAVLDDLGLAAALHWYARNQADRAGCQIEVRDQLSPLLPALETAAFRIVQEAVNNAIRHGSARRIVITAKVHNSALLLAIQDDGCGFDLHGGLTGRDKPGLGLISMRERAELLGGRFALSSQPGAGVQIEVSIPLPLPAS
jgi:PAS domain S-box-containing protein